MNRSGTPAPSEGEVQVPELLNRERGSLGWEPLHPRRRPGQPGCDHGSRLWNVDGQPPIGDGLGRPRRCLDGGM